MPFLQRCLLALLLILVTAPAQAAGDPDWLYRGCDIPRDEAWSFGTLPNGVRYAVRQNALPDEQVSIRVRIDAGSLNEEDNQRGWAHFVTRWTNDWLQPFEEHQREALAAAATLPGVAERIAAGFDDARLFDPWWYDATATAAFLDEQRAIAAGPFDTRDLRRALGQYATGVTVVTTHHDGRDYGMTANSFTSVSLNPPLVLWAAAKSSPSLPAFEAAEMFAVNVLASDQHHLSRQFSTSGPEKFDGVRLLRDGDGPPLLEGTVAHFVCRRTRRVDAGDHVVFFGEIESYEAPGGEPLVFHSGFYRLATKHPDL